MDRLEVRREEDGELVGFVAPSGNRWHALTVFGAPLAEHESRARAERDLRERGLSVLAARWWFEDDAGDLVPTYLAEVTPRSVVAQLTDERGMPRPVFLDGPALDRLRLSAG
jgi:hypothetical protein